MNVNLPEVVTPPSIYHGCHTQNTFWEEKSTLVNMKNCGCCNVRKHREIKDGEKYITLEISLDFGSLYKMKTTYSEPEDYLGISWKGLITSLGLKTIGRSNKNKKSRYAITNVSMKEIHNIIKEFEKLPYEGYAVKRPKHEPTKSCFYLERHLAKCMMRYDTLHFYVYPVRN